MDAFNKLPAPLRIGLPIGLVLIIALVAWMTFMRAPAPVQVLKTADHVQYTRAMELLRDMDAEGATKDGSYLVMVPKSKDLDASTALATAGIKSSGAKGAACKEAPSALTGSKSAIEEAANCQIGKQVEEALTEMGVLSANVKLSKKEGDFLETEKVISVVAQIEVPEAQRQTFDAKAAAAVVATTAGTTKDRVIIQDKNLGMVFDGEAKSAAGAATSPGLASGCADIADAMEVETKRDAVTNCYEQRIANKLLSFVDGDASKFVVTAVPTIDAQSSTSTKQTTTKGSEVQRNESSAGGSRSKASTTEPSTEEKVTMDPAGEVERLAITVVLDDSISLRNQNAIKSMLQSFVVAERRDPAPVVKLADLSDDVASTTPAPAPEATTPAPAANATLAGTTRSKETEMPTWAMGVMGVLVLGIVGALLVMWRRSVAVAAERQKLEASFQQEQRLFENFAQQNPDDLARDLNAMFGAPSAPEPSYRA